MNLIMKNLEMHKIHIMLSEYNLIQRNYTHEMISVYLESQMHVYMT
jgi:hypothetical protein